MKIRITSKAFEAAKQNTKIRLRQFDDIDNPYHKEEWRERERPIRQAALNEAREVVAAEYDKIDRPIEDVLKSINGRARTHAITSGNSIRAIAGEAEKELLARGSKKGSLPGAIVTYTPESPRQSAYKYEVKSTRIELTRTSGGWFLTGVETVYLWPSKKEAFEYSVPLAVHDDILRAALANITVQAAGAKLAA
jgi:hypothetical protein